MMIKTDEPFYSNANAEEKRDKTTDVKAKTADYYNKSYIT